MSVRSGLLASVLVFVMALVVLGAWSAWHLRELGGASRRIIIAPAAVTPGDLLQPIAGRLRPQVEAKGLTLRVEIDPAAAEGALRKCACYSKVPRSTINATVK
jgi:hypothetical protein